MPSFLLSKLKQAQALHAPAAAVLYMGALAALLLAVARLSPCFCSGSSKAHGLKRKRLLTFQMGAFRSDMTSLWRNVSVMGVHLSEDMTAIIEEQT